MPHFGILNVRTGVAALIAALALPAGSALAQSQHARAADSTASAHGLNASTTVTQSQQGPGIPGVGARQSGYGNNNGNHEIFRVLGLSGQITAPVASPYSGSAYTTFGGEPMRGRNAVLAESIDGAP